MSTIKKGALGALYLVMFAFGLAPRAQAEYTDDCITFSSASSFTLKTTKKWDGTLWTSTNKVDWTEWNGSQIAAAQTGGTYNLYVRGNTSNTKITGNYNEWVLAGSNIACTGNIETLRGATGDQPSPTQMANYCYYGMFSGCTALTDAPELPATTLANYCYRGMFYGCTSLTSAPELPATTLARNCYEDMFKFCTSLTTASELPATTLALFCYSQMYQHCESLVDAPALPATNLSGRCYYNMFDGCMSLTNAPALPATTLKSNCYMSMFNGCSSLTNAPALPATALAMGCYDRMFANCTALAVAPALPATTLADSCYSHMFRGCSLLTSAPALPVAKLEAGCYSGMFSASGLESAPVLPATTLADSCYVEMFAYCSSLTNAPALPATTLAHRCYEDMFKFCTSLTKAPALPVTELADCCYRRMFENCKALTVAPALPATTLARECYYQMFERCESLVDAPALPATNLAQACCGRMFFCCSALEVNTAAPGKEWKIPAASTTVADWGGDMFTGTSGTLQGQPALNTTYYIASAPQEPIEPGGEIVVPEGKAEEKANEINDNPTVKAQYLKAPEGVVTTADYLGCFDAVATSGSTVAFVLNENGTNEVVAATEAVNTATLDTVFSEESTMTIDNPLVGFYYSFKQGGDVSVGDKSDLNKLGGRDTISFELTKGPLKYFYQTLVTPTALPAK